MASHYPGIRMTDLLGTNTPKFHLYPLGGDDRRLTLLKNGAVRIWVGSELADVPFTLRKRSPSIWRTFGEFISRKTCVCARAIVCFWAAANGGVTNGGLRGVWPPLLEIGPNRPFSPAFFAPFSGGAKRIWEIQETQEQGLFHHLSSDSLKTPSLKPPFAAL